jgi:hypothetical protein
MSYDVMKACRPLQMPSSPKAVLMALADYADEAGSAWPSIPTLCEYTCLSERTVHAAIKWLEQAKVVVADRANGRHTTYVVDANSFQQPPQQLHPRSSCTPANAAVTTAAVAVVPPQMPQSPPQQLRSNNQEQPREQPGTTNKRVRKPKTPGFDAMTVDLPDWLPAESWERWVRHRAQLKKPITEEAARQQIADLGTFRGQGHKPDDVIRHCIGKSWQGLFPPKQAFGPRAAPAMSEAERRKQEFLRLAGHGGGQDNYTLDMEQA